MKKDRNPRPAGGGAARGYGKPRGPQPRPRAEQREARPGRARAEDRGGERGDYADPYQRARRPGPPREEGRRGFTVTLDPDVARVFRGDASVNKALRLVMQLMHVVQGPPRAFGERPRPARGGYQGSPEARGFTRRPRFDADEEGEIEE